MTNKGGRPKIVFTPEQIIEVGALAAVLSQEQIADYFGIGRTTFFEICERQPEVYEQYKKGKAKAIDEVAKGLILQAKEGNTSAAMFYLKTQAGWRETSVQEITGANGTALQPPVFNIVGVSPKDDD